MTRDTEVMTMKSKEVSRKIVLAEQETDEKIQEMLKMLGDPNVPEKAKDEIRYRLKKCGREIGRNGS